MVSLQGFDYTYYVERLARILAREHDIEWSPAVENWVMIVSAKLNQGLALIPEEMRARTVAEQGYEVSKTLCHQIQEMRKRDYVRGLEITEKKILNQNIKTSLFTAVDKMYILPCFLCKRMAILQTFSQLMDPKLYETYFLR